ncbi:hypothetical protein HYV44_00180 [Candidatus Microgenomates bacterium]|nr:hypothetical protein [Candidatus Microgenomates bacterium]
MLKNISHFWTIIAGWLTWSLPLVVLAQEADPNNLDTITNICSDPNIDGRSLVFCFLRRGINYIAWATGLIMTIMIIVAGFLYTTSGGDPKKVETAKKALTAAIVGGLFTFFSWALMSFIKKILSSAP